MYNPKEKEAGFENCIAKTGETLQTDILVLPSFNLNVNQNNQEGQTGTDLMVTEEETYENQVLPENQDAVQTKECTNNQPNVGLRRSKRPKKRALHHDDYLQDSKHDVKDIEDPMNFKQVMMSDKNEN
ncbi:unnamed protein product [Prunus armeniaca]